MRKLLAILLLVTGLALAFQVGSESSDTPWTGAVAGDVWSTYDFSTGGSYQITNQSPTHDISTLRITNVVAPARVSRNQSYTVSYTVQNRSLEDNINNISASLRFFYTGSTTPPTNGSYTVTPAGGNPTSLAPGASAVFSFTVQTNNAPTGNCVIDGYVSGIVNSTTIYDRYYAVPNVAPVTYNSGAINYDIWREMPATLNIDLFAISSPAGALDSEVSVGQAFVVSVNVANKGEASVGGTKLVNLDLPAGIMSAPSVSEPFLLDGNDITFTITALAPVVDQVITVNIKDSSYAPVGDYPTDLSYPGSTEVGYYNRVATMAITILAPAALDITGMYIPTTDVNSQESTPVVVEVGVQNTGGADALVDLNSNDLSFIVSGVDRTAEFTVGTSGPTATVPGGGSITINYNINQFGAGNGICTINCTLSAEDVNSGAPLSDTATVAEVATFNFHHRILSVDNFQITAPAGAVDGVVSQGQSFDLSLVVNTTSGTIGGNRQVQLVLPAGFTVDTAVQNYTIGVPLSYSVTASALTAGAVITVNIVDTPSPTDTSFVPAIDAGFLVQTATLSVVVEASAVLDITGTYIATTNVEAFGSGPETLEVGVRNTGSATMNVVPQATDLSFVVGGSDQTGTYTITLPAAVNVAGGGQTTLNYTINAFGGGIGICTINASVTGNDLNSGAAINDSTLPAEVSTYNVYYNTAIIVDSIDLDPDPLGYLQNLDVTVNIINEASLAIDARVTPAASDIIIQLNGAGANLNNGTSFNVALVTAPFDLDSGNTAAVIYDITPLAQAEAGVYHVNTLPNRPDAANRANWLPVADPDGLAVAVTFNYDPVSPSVIAATPNIDNVTENVTAPTNNFRIIVEFDEDMDTAALPQFSLDMTAPIALIDGAYLDNRVYRSGAMTLTAANEGWVTVSYTTGAQDLVNNSAIASPDIIVFFVDATTPNLGSVTINNGAVITINPVVNIDLFVSDNFSLTSNMDMQLLSASDVSTNPGLIPLDSFVTFDQQITLNLSSDTLGTKNVYFRFRDQAGNISDIYSSQIYLDTNIISWIAPSDNALLNGTEVLVVQAPRQSERVTFSYIVNGVSTEIGSLVSGDLSVTLSFTYLWDTVLDIATATTNVTINASAYSPALGVISADISGIDVDNLSPNVTITPLATGYVNGTVTITGNAADNQEVALVEVEVQGVNGYLPATNTANWTFDFTVPPADPEGTVYIITARAYDIVGNIGYSSSYTVTKSAQAPIINILTPPSGTFVKGPLPVTGSVTSLLPIGSVDLSLNDPLFTTPIPAIGNSTWRSTINFVVAGTQVVYARVTTDTVPPTESITSVIYELDNTAPVSNFDVLLTGDPVAGTLNITGTSTDDKSGVSLVEINIDGGGWTALSGTSNWSYDWAVPISPAGTPFTIEVRAYDNTYITPNVEIPVLDVSAITVNFDESALPQGGISSPVSGSYVNYNTTISGTSNATQIWLSLNGSGWITANMLTGGNWNYDWTVPPLDAHGTTYDVQLMGRTAKGITGQTTPSIAARYEKDAIGPQSIIINPPQNSSQPAGSYPAAAQIATVGAPFADSWLYYDGGNVVYPANLPAINVSGDIYTYQYDLIVPDDGQWHTLEIVALDDVGNRTTSDITYFFAGSNLRITYPIPTGNIIDFSNIEDNPIYATSVNLVLFENIDIAAVSDVYVDFAWQPVVNVGGRLAVDISTVEADHTITILLSDGTNSTFNSQIVNYDITPPTINAIFNGVHLYYPGATISPQNQFQLNVEDNGGSGFGTTASNNYIEVTDNLTLFTQGTLLRSIFLSGTTTTNMPLTADQFDPYTELYQFDGTLIDGQTYDLWARAVDNAGNVAVTFNINGLVVNAGATGTSGGIDNDLPITSYPNPWNPLDEDFVRFTFYLEDGAERTRIYIYNEIGELLEKLTINGPGVPGTMAGYNEVTWDGLDIYKELINNGIYLYIIAVEGSRGKVETAKGKMVVIQQ